MRLSFEIWSDHLKVIALTFLFLENGIVLLNNKWPSRSEVYCSPKEVGQSHHSFCCFNGYVCRYEFTSLPGPYRLFRIGSVYGIITLKDVKVHVWPPGSFFREEKFPSFRPLEFKSIYKKFRHQSILCQCSHLFQSFLVMGCRVAQKIELYILFYQIQKLKVYLHVQKNN